MINEIVVGRRYRLISSTGRELKPRTVIAFNPNGHLPGGNVRTKTDNTNTIFRELMAGSFFTKHAREFDDPNPGATQ